MCVCILIARGSKCAHNFTRFIAPIKQVFAGNLIGGGGKGGEQRWGRGPVGGGGGGQRGIEKS